MRRIVLLLALIGLISTIAGCKSGGQSPAGGADAGPYLAPPHVSGGYTPG